MIPLIIMTAGTVLNAMLTRKVPLIVGWFGGFAIQAFVRAGIWDVALFSALSAMTGVAFVLFTNYMITDPGTTPSKPRTQFMFGGSVATVYGVLMEFNVTYTLFFALVIVCAIRGIGWWLVPTARRMRSPARGRCRRAERAGRRPGAGAGRPGDGGPVMSDHRIAVVGVACRYPDADSVEQLWQNVLAGRRAFRRLPDERMNLDDYYSPDPAAPDRFYTRKAAVLEGFEFDRVAYRVAGSTFRSTDMTHWLALETVARALQDAGFPNGDGLPRQATGVVLGNTLTGEFSRANVMRLRWPYVRRTVGAELREQGWDDADARPAS